MEKRGKRSLLALLRSPAMSAQHSLWDAKQARRRDREARGERAVENGRRPHTLRSPTRDGGPWNPDDTMRSTERLFWRKLEQPRRAIVATAAVDPVTRSMGLERRCCPGMTSYM